MKKLMIILFAVLMAGPAMADHHEEMTDKASKTKLTETQKKALDAYRADMKAYKESMKASKEDRKIEGKELGEKRKAAFISGDFDTIFKMKDERQAMREANKDKHQAAKAAAMKKAFGDLSAEDRAVLADRVVNNKRHAKMKKKMRDKKEKYKAKRKDRRKAKRADK